MPAKDNDISPRELADLINAANQTNNVVLKDKLTQLVYTLVDHMQDAYTKKKPTKD